jgi:hypothetical protein
MTTVRSVKHRLLACAAASALLFLASMLCAARASNETAPESSRTSTHVVLLAAIGLASDTSATEGEDRARIIGALYDQMIDVEVEIQATRSLLDASPDADFAAIVPAREASAIGYLRAAHQAYARHKGAQLASARDAAAKQITAARKYASLAAEALLITANTNEEHAVRLRGYRFAHRRGPEDARTYVEDLARNGLNAEQRELLQRGGLSAKDIEMFQKTISLTPPEQLGISVLELYARIVTIRRGWARRLQEFAAASAHDTGVLSEGFLVGNPSDREAVVNLFVRRAAMPPEWTIGLKEAEATADQTASRLRELEKGKHYEVRLPPGGQIRLMSEVTPTGLVGENTTARWAIEGRIGEELLGGIVQEVNVPGFLPDLQLPPIAAASPPLVAGLTSPAASSRNIFLIIGAGAVLAIGVALVRRRKRA